MTSKKTPPSLWSGQWLHFAGLSVLLALALVVWHALGDPFPIAFWTTIAVPVVHQVFVWLAWRFELRSQAVSRTIGFRMYQGFFFLLFGGRIASALWLAWLDRGSLGLDPIPRRIITALLLLLGLYTMYSVARYFGFARASGADHFQSRYRDMDPVTEGIFQYTSNGMYVYGFLLFWALAVGFDSAATLVAAVFSHAYIWVHFYATEKPDMAYLYSPAE